MYLAETIDRYKYEIFKRRDELAISHKLGIAFIFACLTGLTAQIRIPLPFTPVPVTGQVFAVLLSGIFLGKYYGGLSQIFYVTIGAIGVPWFNGGSSGIAGIMGITGGYLIGFIPAALMVGWLTSRYSFARRFHFQLLLMAIGVCIIYIFGAAQFAIVTHRGLAETMKLAVIPFIPVDLIKASLAACISASILPKKL